MAVIRCAVPANQAAAPGQFAGQFPQPVVNVSRCHLLAAAIIANHAGFSLGQGIDVMTGGSRVHRDHLGQRTGPGGSNGLVARLGRAHHRREQQQGQSPQSGRKNCRCNNNLDQ